MLRCPKNIVHFDLFACHGSHFGIGIIPQPLGPKSDIKENTEERKPYNSLEQRSTLYRNTFKNLYALGRFLVKHTVSIVDHL